MTRFLRLSLLFMLLTAAWTPLQRVEARPQGLAALQYVEPFLYPPYPGTASEESIFDHSSPNYSATDNRVVTYGGDEAYKNCPYPEPAGYKPPQAGVCDIGSGIYWSYSLGDWMAYNGHDGIDYGMQYRPILAAADADQVVYAGWQDPRDHRYALGLYVKLRHPNGYSTSYGHMSAAAVQSCSTPGCANIPHGEIIGYSGNSGNSGGPHLHFRVGDPTNRSIDPYGWIGDKADPWPYNQRNSLWVEYPSTVIYYGGRVLVYPSGEALPYPSPPVGGTLVDDGTPGFSESPAGCFTITSTAPGQSENGWMRYVRPNINTPTCTARWNFPLGLAGGDYAVYIRIPSVHASSEGALYTINHAGRSDVVTINQEVYPNPYYVTDGWVYVGRYRFLGGGTEYISLTNQTHDTPDAFTRLELGVDAVRFVRVSDLPPAKSPTPTKTPTPSRTFTPSRTPTSTRTFTNTRTPTATPTSSRTFTPSRTPTDTRTPTNTHTIRPTDTRWPSKTFTATRTFTASRTSTNSPGPSPTQTPYLSPTKRPTDTRWPTKTFTPSRTPTNSPTPTSTRTATNTPTQTASRTGTNTIGPSPTRTVTYTRTFTFTPLPSNTRRPTDTRWPTITLRPTDTRWPTRTPIP